MLTHPGRKFFDSIYTCFSSILSLCILSRPSISPAVFSHPWNFKGSILLLTLKFWRNRFWNARFLLILMSHSSLDIHIAPDNTGATPLETVRLFFTFMYTDQRSSTYCIISFNSAVTRHRACGHGRNRLLVLCHRLTGRLWKTIVKNQIFFEPCGCLKSQKWPTWMAEIFCWSLDICWLAGAKISSTWSQVTP